MVLFLVFLMLMLALFALFLGGGLVAQGYLYQNPAERMPLRALAAAVLVAGFMTLWVRIDQRAPGRYDTFFNFTPSSTVEFQEFEAVRWTGAGDKLKLDAGGNPVETTVKFKRAVGGKSGPFLEAGTGEPFKLNGSTTSGTQYMTGAIRVKAADDPEPVRYKVTLKEDPRTKTKTYKPDSKFEEEKGSRYVDAHQMGTLVVPSTGTVVLALLLNFMLMAVWLVAIWPVLRFSLGHAVVFAGALGLITMLAVMPVLFRHVRESKPPAPAAALTRPAVTRV
ncbi:hypothetical protein [Frigoriglobus tundricola]|uniref:Uncharacterized protein n=1 Tax=Frigoriglobus tundricola TaxID=2774151 RepID=A0A6M5YRH6_9BACT|nr:hypothetical protein [Frigoriglobus tundricola]QJW96588.1 hypothetical protein FTUN_4145 [Frigoriglobus tundricola]